MSFAKTGGGTVNAEIAAADSNSLAVRVPSNATSGLVQVSLPDGSASNRAWFTVDTPAKPTVTAVVPDAGAPGQEVRFEGSGFGSAEGLAVFGWADGRYAGQVVSWTDSAVTVKLPPNTGSDVLAYLYGPFGELMAPQLFKYLAGNPRQSGGETGEALGPVVLSEPMAAGWYSVIGRYFYVGTGFGGSTAVDRARIGDDGTLGTWESRVAKTAIPVFSTAFSNQDSLVVGNYAYIFGGIQPGVGGIDAIQVARVLTSDGASISHFAVSPVRLARPIDGNPALKIGKYVYIFGNGWEAGFSFSEYQRISFDDTGLIQKVEKFASGPDRISSPWGQAVRVHRSDQGYIYQEQDFVYLMGGGWPNARRILRASVNPDGSLGPFADCGKSLLRDFYAGSVYVTDKHIYVFNGDRSMCNVTRMDVSGNGDIGNAYCYATSGNELQYAAVARLGRHFYVVNYHDGGQRVRDFTID